MTPKTRIDQQILQEIQKAAVRLGATRAEVRTLQAHQAYAALESLAADRQLLAVVGSWKDCLEDTEVLDLLKEWNRFGRIEFDKMYVSTTTIH